MIFFMFMLTLARAVGLLGGAFALLVSVLVAFPTERMFDQSWGFAALLCAGLYVFSTWLFVKIANRQNRLKAKSFTQ